MGQVNRQRVPIRGGHARVPNWFVDDAMPTLAKLPAAVPVWLALARWQELSDARRSRLFMSLAFLAHRTGYQVGAVRAAVAELEHRGLIVRVAGPSRSGGGRLATEWSVPTVSMPAGALEPSEAYLGRVARASRPRRGGHGRFEPSVAPRLETLRVTEGSPSETLRATDGTLPETLRVTDDSQPNAPEVVTVVDADGWYVSGPGIATPAGSWSPDSDEPAEAEVDPYSVNPRSTREYEPGRQAVVQFHEDR